MLCELFFGGGGGYWKWAVMCSDQGRQENCWAPGQKETWPPSSNSPNNDTQTKLVHHGVS